jgi:hypothetical protein
MLADDAPATDNMRRLWHKLDAAKSNHRRWLLTDANAERARSAQLGNQTRELYEEFLQGVQLEFLQLLTNSDLSLLHRRHSGAVDDWRRAAHGDRCTGERARTAE